jgi:hypothetical protein
MLKWIGLALIVIGVVEFLLFTYLAPRKPDIAGRKRFLDLNAGFNTVLGTVLLIVGS